MKKYTIIAAFLALITASMSACSASGRIGTKNHGVGVGAEVK